MRATTLALAALLVGCTSVVDPAPATSRTAAAAPAEPIEDAPATPEPTPGAALFDKHLPMLEAVVARLAAPEIFVDGQWHKHYGDAPMYGPAFDLAWWARTQDVAHKDRAVAALERNLVVVEDAIADTLGAVEQLETVAMSLLGLFEAGLYLDDERYHEAADTLMITLDSLTVGLGDYLEMDVGAFAANTYGPTAISSFMALLHLEHALAHPDHDREHHLQRARDILKHVWEIAFDEQLGALRFAPDDTRLMLYPNITMMLAYGRAYQLDPDPQHIEKIRTLFAGIQPLKDPDGDNYHSPYSAEYMGATDPNYTTLSSQNYLMLGLWLAHTATGEVAWLDELELVLDFVATHLLDDHGRIVHHWMNGGPAVPEDPEYYCTGCNLQTLYMMMQLQ